MKVKLLLITLLGLLSVSILAQPVKVFEIENFEDEEVGKLPKRWFNQKGEAKPITYSGELRETYHYEVLEEEENKFLRFNGKRGKHMSYPLLNSENLDIYETPVLSWKWRVHEIPAGANENESDKNDVAASIYVAFDLGRVLFKKVPKTIRYTWSSTLPVGTELSKFYGNQKIIVVGMGDNKIGEWQSFDRNIVEDYKRLFGDPPPNKPIAILILSDADNASNISKADYDDLLLKSVQH